MSDRFNCLLCLVSKKRQLLKNNKITKNTVLLLKQLFWLTVLAYCKDSCWKWQYLLYEWLYFLQEWLYILKELLYSLQKQPKPFCLSSLSIHQIKFCTWKTADKTDFILRNKTVLVLTVITVKQEACVWLDLLYTFLMVCFTYCINYYFP